MFLPRRSFIALLASAALPWPALAADANVAGQWELTVETQLGIGTPHFKLEQNGSAVTGTYQGQFGEAPVSGQIKGNELRLSLKVSAQGTDFEIVYTGTIDSETVRGQVAVGGVDRGSFTGKRT